MSSLNLSTNGPSITKSYKTVVDAPLPTGAAASSPTYGHWALFTVSAPLVNAFQSDSSKESVLKVQSSGEGELVDLIDDFSDGRIQFAFVKVKDPNTGLPKNVLIAWCGEGVPERTKGYFTSHMTAVAKLLHGYHVQVTARSDRDLTPEGIVQKVADSSGSKYSAGSAPPPVAANTKPPVSSKPAFTPTRSSGAGAGYNPSSRLGGGRPKDASLDEDGWGADAPQVTRTQLEKVQSAYQPTKVNLKDLQSQGSGSSGYQAPRNESTNPDVVRGAYQPIGKVDINEIRRQARESGNMKDDRPETVKGSYEPIGKVDIAAIRAKAQKPADSPAPSAPTETPDAPRSLPDRSAPFSSGERLTSMPKPKVANKFGGGSSFTGTTAPTPGGFGAKPVAAAPIGGASRTFADSGGKTPAQIWAERKARERGTSGSGQDLPAPSAANPVQSQQSGGAGAWESGYSGKKWGAVSTSKTGGSVEHQRTDPGAEEQEEASEPPSAGIGSIRDRFSQAPPMGAPAPAAAFDRPAPEPVESTKPNRGFAMPGLAQPEEEEAPALPTPPPVPRSPTPPTPEARDTSPIRVAMPVGRGAPEEITDVREEQQSPPPPMPVRALETVAAHEQEDDDEPEPDFGRAAATAAATSTFGHEAVENTPAAASSKGKTAVAQFDYDADESNEISLKEGEHVTDIDMVDDDWWMGTNSQGQSGLFPSNYVELVEGEDDAGSAPPAPPAAPAAPAEPEHSGHGQTATSVYDYEAGEPNELSFPEGAKITNIEFPDDDWWMGEYEGKQGLFPANYVQLDE